MPSTQECAVAPSWSRHRLASRPAGRDMLRRTKWDARRAGVSLIPPAAGFHFVPHVVQSWNPLCQELGKWLEFGRLVGKGGVAEVTAGV
ncbi:MAG: hypothetical protein Q7S84_01645 [bacterium]|nr:hypothetical protein [bacterium]